MNISIYDSYYDVHFKVNLYSYINADLYADHYLEANFDPKLFLVYVRTQRQGAVSPLKGKTIDYRPKKQSNLLETRLLFHPRSFQTRLFCNSEA